MVAVAFCIVAAEIDFTVRNQVPANRDFIEYWAAEQGLVHHANPYDWAATLQEQRSVGLVNGRPEFWYSPPADLILALPFGYVSARTGLLLWMPFNFALLSVSIWMLWCLHGKPNSLLYLLGFLFAPELVCIQAGQISFFFLFGIMLFLTFHESKPWLAGAALLPCTLKPHLFLAFGVALILWIVVRKAYGILGGFLAAIAAGTAITFCYDPHAWSQYSAMMKSEGMLHEFVPTLSETLRYMIDRDAVWLQFVPCVLGSCWAVWYFWSRRGCWNWMDHGLLLLLVSALCRPYGWIFDESVLMPAVMTGVIRARQSGRSLWPIAIIGALALFEAFQSVKITSTLYLWTTPAWLAWYLNATWPKAAPAGQALGNPSAA